MYSPLKRSYRKSLTSPGLIYVGGKERAITVKNISITGAFAELNNSTDIANVYTALSASTTLDLYLPELQLAGEAEIVRVETEENQISLAIKFKHVTHDVDNLSYKRKAYRKRMTIPGEILLHGDYHGFVSVNMSTDGMMIRLAEPVNIEKGAITEFKFDQLGLEGEIKIVWVDVVPNAGTWVGVQYINMDKDAIKGVPKFSVQ